MADTSALMRVFNSSDVVTVWILGRYLSAVDAGFGLKASRADGLSVRFYL